jgi:hypothetical protein
MKLTPLWDIALSSLVKIDQCLGGADCLHRQGKYRPIFQKAVIFSTNNSFHVQLI